MVTNAPFCCVWTPSCVYAFEGAERKGAADQEEDGDYEDEEDCPVDIESHIVLGLQGRLLSLREVARQI